ncbi:MAG: glycosyltransferase family 2 protein [Anaerolineales bacterium]
MSLTMVAERPAQARGAEEASEPFGVAGIEVSVVMPCLNEAEAIAYCIQKALKAFVDMDARGEVVVVDNGSTDRSTEIATAMGARVVSEPDRGYGNAYRAGIRAARGRYIVMGDSDGTYDFGDIPLFVEPLLNGTDVVIGSRLRGTIEPGAMPWLHRYIGNPLLTGFLNVLFAAGVSDAHCGMRSFRRQALGQLSLSAPGMEFASELIIETVRNGLRLKEIPIYYARRAGGAPKLRTWRDGTRHLWLMLTKAFSDPLDRNADPRLSQASKTDRADRTHH